MNIIIGAGLTGLSTAYHLESDDYVVFEARQEVGGLCTSRNLDGFTFDITGHVLHFKHDYTHSLASNLLAGNLHKVRRRSSIFFEGILVPYPFQMNLYSLPEDVKAECLEGVYEAARKPMTRRAESFEEWILASLGKGIAKHFMIPYNEKLWTVHPREMSTTWLKGFVPEPDVEAIVEGAEYDCKDRHVGYNAEFWYPLEGGIGTYPQAFLPFVDNLHLGVSVESIDVAGRTVLAGGERHRYSNLVSTAGVVDLVDMLEQAPEEIVASAQRLRANAVYSILLGIARPRLSEKHWIYVPQKELAPYRIGIPSNLSPKMAPEGTSSMCVEVAFRGDLGLSVPDLVERTIQDLKTMGLLRVDDEILVAEAVETPRAYVIYDFARDASLELIQDYLRAHRIYSIGRYGSWEYSTMEDAVLAGKETAELLSGQSAASAAA